VRCVLESGSLSNSHELELVDVQVGNKGLEQRNEFFALVEDRLEGKGEKLVSDLMPHLSSVVVLDGVDLVSVRGVGGLKLIEDL